MIKNNFLQQIRLEIPMKIRKNVRKYADSLISKREKEKEEVRLTGKCTNCQCQDFEDWLVCDNKK